MKMDNAVFNNIAFIRRSVRCYGAWIKINDFKSSVRKGLTKHLTAITNNHTFLTCFQRKWGY